MTDFKDMAEFFKVVAHPARIEILSRLESGILCVSDMEGFLGVAQPNVSQHLSVMRKAGLVDYFIDGKQRCYFLKDPRAIDVLVMTSKKYRRELPRPSRCEVNACKAARRTARAASRTNKTTEADKDE